MPMAYVSHFLYALKIEYTMLQQQLVNANKDVIKLLIEFVF